MANNSMRTYRPPSVKWILNRYRNYYTDMVNVTDYEVLSVVLLRPCPGVSILDRWAVWVYMQDKGLSWKRVYDKIINEEWMKAKHVQKIKQGI